MKIVTVGTGVIVEEFITAAKQVNTVEIVGTYSRDIARAEEFSKKMGIIKYYDSISTIIGDEDVNTIYIATPNALHYSQAKHFLENGKNVIIEKPIMSTAEHAKELLEIAKSKNLFLVEAISNVHTPNFQFIKENIGKLGDIKMVMANYSQYSSRFDLFKDGELPNVFNPKFSGGALMDLNIYNVNLIYHLFGLPKSTTYFPNMMKGIDPSGVIVMDYGSFKATATAAKDSASQSFFQVQGDEGYIYSAGATNELREVHFETADEKIDIDYNTKHRLYSEIEEFGKLFKEEDYDKVYEKFEKSIEVISIIEDSWRQAELGFEDK